MYTDEDYIKTLSLFEKRIIGNIRESYKDNNLTIKSAILMYCQVVPTDLIVSVMWSMHNSNIIAKDIINGKEISTVFLTNSQCGKHFETMVFGNESIVYDRYKTYDEAVKNHEQLCKNMRQS